jgi:uncharacterized protein (TIGR03437 family)
MKNLAALSLIVVFSAVSSMAQIAVNAASGASAVAPGSLISIYGSFSLSTGQAMTLPLPTTTPFGYYRFVLFSGGSLDLSMTSSKLLPLLYWSASQVNAFLPTAASPGALIAVRHFWQGADLPAGAASLNLQVQAPGMFTNYVADCSISAQGCAQKLTRAIITDSKYSPIASTNPARPGQGLVIWCTGLGIAATTPQVTLLPPTGTPISAAVFYSGHQASFVGLDQVNFYVPSATSLGSPCVVGSHLEVLISIKSTTSGVVSNVASLPIVVDSCAPNQF